jgi:hypothetical protein
MTYTPFVHPDSGKKLGMTAPGTDRFMRSTRRPIRTFDQYGEEKPFKYGSKLDYPFRSTSLKPIKTGTPGTEGLPKLPWGMKRRTDKQMKASRKSNPTRTYKGRGGMITPKVNAAPIGRGSGINGGVTKPKKITSPLRWLNTPFGRHQ